MGFGVANQDSAVQRPVQRPWKTILDLDPSRYHVVLDLDETLLSTPRAEARRGNCGVPWPSSFCEAALPHWDNTPYVFHANRAWSSAFRPELARDLQLLSALGVSLHLVTLNNTYLVPELLRFFSQFGVRIHSAVVVPLALGKKDLRLLFRGPVAFIIDDSPKVWVGKSRKLVRKCQRISANLSADAPSQPHCPPLRAYFQDELWANFLVHK